MLNNEGCRGLGKRKLAFFVRHKENSRNESSWKINDSHGQCSKPELALSLNHAPQLSVYRDSSIPRNHEVFNNNRIMDHEIN